jgi:hypothetical protein
VELTWVGCDLDWLDELVEGEWSAEDTQDGDVVDQADIAIVWVLDEVGCWLSAALLVWLDLNAVVGASDDQVALGEGSCAVSG